jgi:hypothetical protein
MDLKNRLQQPLLRRALRHAPGALGNPAPFPPAGRVCPVVDGRHDPIDVRPRQLRQQQRPEEEVVVEEQPLPYLQVPIDRVQEAVSGSAAGRAACRR